jgi:hypothetical protein
MKINNLFLVFIIVIFASCSSAYHIGQTPDDVYYSPAPPQPAAYITTNNQQDKDSYAYNNDTNNQDIPETGVYNSFYNPYYGSGLSLSFGSGYSPFNYYGSSFYNPYSFYTPLHSGLYSYPFYNNYDYGIYSPCFSGYCVYNDFYTPSYHYNTPVYYSGKPSYTGIYRGPRQYNLAAYNYNNRVSPTNTDAASAPVRSFRSQQPQQRPVRPTTGVGGFIRRIFTTSNDNNHNNGRSYNNNNNSSPVRETNSSSRSNNNGSSSSSSGSSGGGGSAPSRSFRH